MTFQDFNKSFHILSSDSLLDAFIGSWIIYLMQSLYFVELEDSSEITIVQVQLSDLTRHCLHLILPQWSSIFLSCISLWLLRVLLLCGPISVEGGYCIWGVNHFFYTFFLCYFLGFLFSCQSETVECKMEAKVTNQLFIVNTFLKLFELRTAAAEQPLGFTFVPHKLMLIV